MCSCIAGIHQSVSPVKKTSLNYTKVVDHFKTCRSKTEDASCMLEQASAVQLRTDWNLVGVSVNIAYLLRSVCTQVHALPHSQFESLLPHIKPSGCEINMLFSIDALMRMVLKYAAYPMIMEQLQLLSYDENLHLQRHTSKCVDCK